MIYLSYLIQLRSRVGRNGRTVLPERIFEIINRSNSQVDCQSYDHALVNHSGLSHFTTDLTAWLTT